MISNIIINYYRYYITGREYMMKRNIILMIIAVMVVMLGGCNGANSDRYIEPKGKVVSQSYRLKNYTKLNISKDFTVNIRKGVDYEATITTNEDLFEYLDVYVSNGTLYATYREDTIIVRPTITLDIVIPTLEAVSAKNDSKVEMKDTLTSISNFAVELKNDAALRASIEAFSLKATLSNDSKLVMLGVIESLNIEGTNDAMIDLRNVNAKKATVNLKNDAICSINISDNVDVTAKSDSNLNVYGGGKINKVDVAEDVIIKQLDK